jgi:nitroimidazol reductase NimA-like FMN-containing flavoprotein (pyridoxamine 5'-phosphate oxidase superfamily)
MRRKEKEITSRGEMDQIIHNSLICHLSCSLNDQPYVVPISFGYDGNAVYFHTAQEGKKNSILSANPQVCLGFEGEIQIQPDPDLACRWSFHYQSVIATGVAEVITNPKDRLYGIKQIMLHFSDMTWEIPEKELSRVTIWQVILTEITGKISPASKS